MFTREVEGSHESLFRPHVTSLTHTKFPNSTDHNHRFPRC